MSYTEGYMDKLVSNVDQASETRSLESSRLISFIFLVLGLTQLLPWYCFINSYGYWMLKFTDNETAYEAQTQENPYPSTDYQNFWTSSLTVASSSVLVIFMVVNLIITSKISRDSRVYPSLAIMFLVFAFTTIMSVVDTSDWTSIFFVLALLSAMICQMGGGIFQGATMGLAGNYPGNYFNWLLQGQIVAGVFSAVLALIPMFIFKKEVLNADGDMVFIVDQYKTALMFFAVATVAIAVCIFLYWVLMKHWVTKEVLKNERKAKDLGLAEIFSNILRVGKSIGYQTATLTVNFWITIAFFPAVTQLVVSACTPDSESSYCTIFGGEFFMPVFNFLFYNIICWFGRWLAGKIKIIKKEQGLMLLVSAMLRIFIALLFLGTRRSNYDGWSFLGNDWAYILIMFAFGITDGYVPALAFEYGPQLVEGAEVELAGSMMPIFMGMGLLLGSLSSFGTVSIMPVN